MRVLFVLASTRVGGAEKYLSTLASELAKHNVAVDLLSLTKNDSKEHISTDCFGNVEELTLSRSLLSIPAVIRRIKKSKYDAVLSSVTHVNLAVLLAQLFAFDPPHIVVRETNVLTKTYLGTGSILRQSLWRLLFRLYRRAGVVVAQSEFMRDELMALGISQSQIAVIGNHIDPPALNNVARPLCFVQVGSLNDVKNNRLAIEALAEVRDSDATLTLVGTGENEHDLRELGRKLGLADRLIFCGHVSDVESVLVKHKIYLQTSHYDSFPNSVLEAIGCGLYVIAADAPGAIREIVNDTCGRVVVPDKLVLAAHMREALGMTIDHAAIRKNGASRFSKERSLNAYLSAFACA